MCHSCPGFFALPPSPLFFPLSFLLCSPVFCVFLGKSSSDSTWNRLCALDVMSFRSGVQADSFSDAYVEETIDGCAFPICLEWSARFLARPTACLSALFFFFFFFFFFFTSASGRDGPIARGRLCSSCLYASCVGIDPAVRFSIARILMFLGSMSTARLDVFGPQLKAGKVSTSDCRFGEGRRNPQGTGAVLCRWTDGEKSLLFCGKAPMLVVTDRNVA